MGGAWTGIKDERPDAALRLKTAARARVSASLREGIAWRGHFVREINQLWAVDLEQSGSGWKQSCDFNSPKSADDARNLGFGAGQGGPSDLRGLDSDTGRRVTP